MCGGAKWKREVVPDHKFDFVDTTEFTDNGFVMRAKYLLLYITVLIGFLVYVSDIFSAITMLTTSGWSNQIFEDCSEQAIEGCIAIPFNTGKWLFVGCIIFSFLLLAYEARKAKKIVSSRDISYAFTNVMANNYYSLKSYDHFCFFSHIKDSTKTSDDFVFFVFFTFKSWKRVLLADGPRQTINALTLYAIYLSKRDKGDWYDITKYFDGNTFSTSVLTVTTFFTTLVFAINLIFLLVAGICYIPLLMKIRGNLKEYCCHKVDKRISTVIKRRQKRRLADNAKLAQKEAMGDFSHLKKNKKGEVVGKRQPQPTLPNISLDDEDEVSSMKTRGITSNYAASTYTYSQDQYYSNGADYPPMPAYNPNSAHQPNNTYAQFNQSQNFGYEESAYNYSAPHMYEDENESTAHLTSTAAPFAQVSQYSLERPGTTPPMSTQHSNNSYYDPHDVYQGRAISPSPQYQQQSPQQYYESGYENGYNTQDSVLYSTSQHVNPPSHTQKNLAGHDNSAAGGAGGYAV